jgi:hypothetical protein
MRGIAMGASGASQGNDASIARRLAAATDELQVLEKLVISGDCSPRVLSEFRAAVDSIRRTTWAVQQWCELQQQRRDPYSVLDVLAQVRVERATQLSRELTMDLQSLELSLETEGLAELYRTTRGLYECLAPLFRKSEV